MNFTETPAIRNPREFLAVILAGFGSELQPLTSNYGDQPCPKALLPIGNKPLISYVLSWVEDSGIQDVLVICPTAHREPLLHHINSDPSSSSTSTLHIDVQTFDQSSELPAGTASVLAHFASRITGDFVLLPCDFVPPPSLRLETVLNKFRVESSADGALATALFFERPVPAKVKGGADDADAWGPLPDALPVVYDEKSGTLLHLDTLDDRDRDEEDINLRMGLLNRYPRMRMTTKLADAHVYVCRPAVLQVLQEKKAHFDSVREEFMPWLCKVQTQRTKREKYSSVLNPITNITSPYSLALQHSTLHSAYPKRSKHRRAAPASPAHSTHSHSTPKASQPSSPTHDSDDEPEDEPSLRIGLVLHRLADGYAARANDPWNYMELNRMALNDIPSQSYDPLLVDQKCNISADSLVGESTRVGERTSVKRSVVGRHCVLGKNVKLNGCVLMEYCVVDDGAKLEGCILGKNTHVGTKAELVRCITQAGYEVEADGIFKNEKLDVSDWTAGPTGSSEEDEDEDEEEDDEDEDEDEDEEEEEEEEDEEEEDDETEEDSDD